MRSATHFWFGDQLLRGHIDMLFEHPGVSPEVLEHAVFSCRFSRSTTSIVAADLPESGERVTEQQEARVPFPIALAERLTMNLSLAVGGQ